MVGLVAGRVELLVVDENGGTTGLRRGGEERKEFRQHIVGGGQLLGEVRLEMVLDGSGGRLEWVAAAAGVGLRVDWVGVGAAWEGTEDGWLAGGRHAAAGDDDGGDDEVVVMVVSE